MSFWLTHNEPPGPLNMKADSLESIYSDLPASNILAWLLEPINAIQASGEMDVCAFSTTQNQV